MCTAQRPAGTKAEAEAEAGGAARPMTAASVAAPLLRWAPPCSVLPLPRSLFCFSLILL